MLSLAFLGSVLRVLAVLNGVGAGTWLVLIAIDTVVGIFVRSGNGGVFSWSYVQHFLVTCFATTEVKAMAGLLSAAVVSAVTSLLLKSPNPDLATFLQVIVNAALVAFAGAVASQDLALLKDIVAKLSGQSAGQLARKTTLHKLRV